jgi:SAM-dependent methyltransferase
VTESQGNVSVQPISLAGKARSWVELWREYRVGNADSTLKRHEELVAIFREMHQGTLEGARVLDLGCGQLSSQVALFTADGAITTGIDVELPSFRLPISLLLAIWRSNGVERALKSLVRHVFFDRNFFKRVIAHYRRPVSWEHLDVRRMDASHMEFESRTFDFIFSDWAFEHIADVGSAIREVRRVLKPDGIFHASVHLFPSLSGGHNLEWHYPAQQRRRKAPPWDHLRDDRVPANAYLNRMRLSDYKRVFDEHLVVESEWVVEEGPQWLTSELEQELTAKGFTRQDLLTRSWYVVAKPLESGHSW